MKSGLPASTRRRLLKLPQIPSVWEGERREFRRHTASVSEGECILWVDGSQGIVRSMEVIPPEAGMEAMARALVQAMERPHSAGPARPKKVVVRDREVQFFLRGVLQDLEIKVDCQPDLPLIDEIFESFIQEAEDPSPLLPEKYADLLLEKAQTLWADAPWNYLEDHQILSIQLNGWDLDTLYVSVMGMLGMEYGILFYRSLDTLRQFRQLAVERESSEAMEEAFRSQDCLFLTYGAEDPDRVDLEDLPDEAIFPTFGSIHPLEGLRPQLSEEEAEALLVALEALHRFLRQNRRYLRDGFQARSGRYRIPHPAAAIPLMIPVQSLPEVAIELLEAEGSDDDDVEIHEDLIPEKSVVGLGALPWSVVEYLRHSPQVVHHASQPEPPIDAGDGLPVLLVRTSRPKARLIIERLQKAGGIRGLCVNPGLDPENGMEFDLEIAQLGNGELHYLMQFPAHDPVHMAAIHKWEQRAQATQGSCGIMIAMGVTAAEMQLRHMLALFEGQMLDPRDLGLSRLVRVRRDLW